MNASARAALSRVAATLVALLFLGFLLTTTGQARIAKIVYGVPSPAGGGYEMISGTAYGEVNPFHPQNAPIQDIELAPRNASGMVEYSMKFTILVPPDGGNGLLFYEVVNRGFPLTEFGSYFRGLGNMVRQRSYTIVRSGWQGNLAPVPFPIQHRLQVPVATDNGSEITGRVRVEYVVDEWLPFVPLSGLGSAPYTSYEPVDLTKEDAVLTYRVKEADPPVEIPKADWEYAKCSSTPFPGVPSPNHVCLKDGFGPNYLYELTYTGKNPLVLGLGLAATRDLVSFLRYEEEDDFGTPNPVAGTTRAAVMWGASQSARYMRTFLQLGFNQAEGEGDGPMVFEGMNPHIGPGRVAVNIRFGQPGGSSSQHGNHLSPGWATPLTWKKVLDPLTGLKTSLLERCRKTDTCPKIIETVSSNEYWKLRASLSATDALGLRDIKPPGNVRRYLFSSTQHVPAGMPGYGICQQLNNPNDYRPYLQALVVALERWVLEGEEHGGRLPQSQVPTIHDGTLVSSAEAAIGWPDIPGVKYTGLVNTLPLINRGTDFNHEDETGIAAQPPLVVPGTEYNVLVPRVDEDGNEIAGIRTVTLQVPLGTYTGWNLRAAGFAEDEQCGQNGSFIPFAETQLEREASGDPRLSLEERYGDHEGYVEAVKAAADRLVAKGYLLPEDAIAIIAQAQASNVLLP